MRNITITINGKKVETLEGKTILEIAKENRIDLPNLCWHSDLKVKAGCRLCLVEIKGRGGLDTACSTLAEDGMEIVTESLDLTRIRKINLELIFAQHKEECSKCPWGEGCRLLDLAKKYGVNITRFKDRKKDFPCYRFGPSLEFDSSKCIDCRNCVEVCERQGMGFLEVKENKDFFQIIPSKSEKKDCIFCGQCIIRCPAGAVKEISDLEEVEKALGDKNKIVVVQFAPSIRTSIGEDFGMGFGQDVTGKLISALKKTGFKEVFDVCVGADVTTIEEADELIERVKGQKNLPLFTSCCPAWVKFVEFYRPDLIPNLTSVRSPHIILGGLIKDFWAKKEKIDRKKIVVVSIMPCVAKKYEIRRKELRINGLKPVDFVLTTRELALLFNKKKIDLKNIDSVDMESPFGVPSGAGIIYGASGGVMESALRTAYAKITGNNLPKIEFGEVRGLQGTKKAEIKINDKVIKVAVVNGIKNAEKILDELKKDPKAFDYVEVMACFGGCIGGGGQPLPSDAKIREERKQGLYFIDEKQKIRLADENPIVKAVYKDFLNKENVRHNICHTRYRKKKKEVKF